MADHPSPTFADLWPRLPPDVQRADPSSSIRGGETEVPSAMGPIPGHPGAVGPLGDLLGRGGMGEVRRAAQRSVGRSVAVKVTRQAATHPAAVRQALQEAWITAMLEHGNIIPVYDIVADDQGRPMILMRAVRGRTWSSLLSGDSARIARFADHADALGWHVATLMRVCDAVAFAHERGVLHRDLKPENVMIGEYGEVHVLDWGLGVALDDRHPPWIPRAADQRRLVGTPRYMAPEMTTGDGRLLSERTDVYLLGACLHEILTGRPPHVGSDLRALLAAIPDFCPTFGPDVPPPLADLAAACLRADPAARPARVAEVRAALAHWAATRNAVELVRRADALREALVADLAGPPRPDPSDGPSRRALYAQLSAARFAYQQALREWPEHPHAAGHLDRMVGQMVDYELRTGHPEAAEALLVEIAHPPSDLRDRVAAAREAAVAEAARLQGLAADVDPKRGIRTRLFTMVVVGGFWLSLPVGLLATGHTPTWTTLLVATGAMIVAFGALVVWARDSLSRSRINRATVITAMCVPFAHSITDALAWSSGQPAPVAFAWRISAWALIAVMYAATVHPGFTPAAIGYVLAAAWAMSDPAAAPLAALAVNLGLILNLAILWVPAWLQLRWED